MRIRLLFASAVLAFAADTTTVQPQDLVARLHASGAPPVIVQVGPNVLYRSKHIPGAVYAGPAAEPQGLAALRAAVEKLPRDREIVIYCGCCPWDHCPNIKPAMEALRAMGFTRAKAMYVATSFKTDWIDRGFPVVEGQSR